MKRILFRADAKPSIGIGDLISLINLSFYLNPREWECFFMIKSYPAAIKLVNRVRKRNIFFLDELISIESEVSEINRVVQIYGIDVLFFEITEQRLSQYIGLVNNVKKACVNFNSYLLEDLDLVVNWDVEADQYMCRSGTPNAKFLLGYEYVILPKQFYELQERKYKDKICKLLIAMGGADEFDFTMKIVEVLIENNIEIDLNIIVGSGYENKAQLEKALYKSQLNFTIKQDVSNMLGEYIGCDLAIGAGGLTASELVASKTPALLIATYEHQISRCKFFSEKGFATYLGFRTFDKHQLIKSVKEPRKVLKDVFFNTQRIIDEVYALV